MNVDFPTFGIPTTMTRIVRPACPFSSYAFIFSARSERTAGANCLTPVPLFADVSMQLFREEPSLPGSEKNALSMMGLNGLEASGGVNARPQGPEALLKKKKLLGDLNRAFVIRQIPFSGGMCMVWSSMTLAKL